MQFKNEANAAAAFKAAGFGSDCNVIDDEEVVWAGVDTFYGYSQDESIKDRGLDYLREQIK